MDISIEVSKIRSINACLTFFHA